MKLKRCVRFKGFKGVVEIRGEIIPQQRRSLTFLLILTFVFKVVVNGRKILTCITCMSLLGKFLSYHDRACMVDLDHNRACKQ